MYFSSSDFIKTFGCTICRKHPYIIIMKSASSTIRASTMRSTTIIKSSRTIIRFSVFLPVVNSFVETHKTSYNNVFQLLSGYPDSNWNYNLGKIVHYHYVIPACLVCNLAFAPRACPFRVYLFQVLVTFLLVAHGIQPCRLHTF